MVFDGGFDALGLDAYVTLGDGGGAVLEQLLDKDDVTAVGLVDFRGVPLPEAVGADALIAQIVTHQPQLFLDGTLCDGEHPFVPADSVAEAVIFHVLPNDQRNGEHPCFAGFLLGDFEAEPVSVPDNVAQTQLQDIADPQPQIGLQNQCGGDALIGTTAGEASLHSADNLLILLCGECPCFLVHGGLLFV